MLNNIGYTNKQTVFYMRDNGDNSDAYGLRPYGFFLLNANCSTGAGLHQKQGELYVR